VGESATSCDISARTPQDIVCQIVKEPYATYADHPTKTGQPTGRAPSKETYYSTSGARTRSLTAPSQSP